ncbi:hypothetical protein LEP1GSC035_2410 [Leptospira noguchii str. 2007001578]|uniref:Uncharacterized protein n=1 Tax=Leptospira noguchii str. 2007001578 TaxID=1049974 RepID=A0ABN0J3X6_9LEPT|nr:hypothetical protein LEP1GSC035_2410 [Leptospira noguchii str. 2007001578]
MKFQSTSFTNKGRNYDATSTDFRHGRFNPLPSQTKEEIESVSGSDYSQVVSIHFLHKQRKKLETRMKTEIH